MKINDSENLNEMVVFIMLNGIAVGVFFSYEKVFISFKSFDFEAFKIQ